MPVERTLVLLKPDAVVRQLSGQILARFEAKGLQIVGLKLLQITPALAKQHYAEHVQKPFYPNLESFITSGPSVALVLEGLGAIAVVRGMMGPTNGREAAPGTIRGDFGMSRQMNLVHGSDGPEAAAKEIGIYFSPAELISSPNPLAFAMNASDEK